jgi:hypothetical protein
MTGFATWVTRIVSRQLRPTAHRRDYDDAPNVTSRHAPKIARWTDFEVDPPCQLRPDSLDSGFEGDPRWRAGDASAHCRNHPVVGFSVGNSRDTTTLRLSYKPQSRAGLSGGRVSGSHRVPSLKSWCARRDLTLRREDANLLALIQAEVLARQGAVARHHGSRPSIPRVVILWGSLDRARRRLPAWSACANPILPRPGRGTEVACQAAVTNRSN